MNKIQVIENWERSEELLMDRFIGKYPIIIEDREDMYLLRTIVWNESLYHDWEVPKDRVEIVSSFRGWLNHLNNSRT